MAYTRPCNKCGQRISLREMPHGQWVAFDVSTEETHVCGVQHEPDVAVKLKGKDKFRDKEDESIDIGYDSDEGSDDLDEIEEEIYDTSSGINNCIKKALKEKKRIEIEYNSNFTYEHTSRVISPIKKFKHKNRNYLQAYCHMRKAQRSFLISSIEQATLLDKKLFKPKKIEKPNIDKFLKKIENETATENETTNYQTTASSPGFFATVWEFIVPAFWILLIGAWMLDACS